VTTLEAILMRLWAAEISGSKRASRVRLQFKDIASKNDKEREISLKTIFNGFRSRNEDRKSE
jgi:hypothetical protein